ncbi:MAG: DUF1080 domain-containing protein [Planctomycetia bacterium]|nr:DUF1080 domain-containing protein [Planctomycetia bacterium]
MKRQLILLTAMTAVLTAFAFSTLSAQEEGFVSLFNGKDLTGWKGDQSIWSVENGAIVGKTTKIPYNHSLAYKEEFSDFILRFDYRLPDPKAGNSGFYYRGWYLSDSKPYQMGGYQADFDAAATYSGIVYGEALRGILAQRGTISHIGDNHKPVVMEQFAKNEDLKKLIKPGDWNSYEVIAQGYLFIHKINGKVMSVLIDADKKTRRDSGMIGIQVHVGPPMKVEVKNIRIKKLK